MPYGIIVDKVAEASHADQTRIRYTQTLSNVLPPKDNKVVDGSKEQDSGRAYEMPSDIAGQPSTHPSIHQLSRVTIDEPALPRGSNRYSKAAGRCSPRLPPQRPLAFKRAAVFSPPLRFEPQQQGARAAAAAFYTLFCDRTGDW